MHGAAQMTLPCTISDLSDAGARVTFQAADAIAPPFLLLDMTNGVGYRADQAWREGARMGLTFTNRFDAAKPAPGDPAIFHRLWAERVR